ncbi:MAG: ROK family transcriptional regulator [Halanaerobiaceae bacterium]
MKITGNMDLMRELNTKHILQALRRQSPISRSEIVERTNLTAATVSRIVNKLMEFNLIKEKGFGQSRGGRRPILLELNTEALLTIGIDIEMDEVNGVIIDLDGKILAKKRAANRGNVSEENILQLVKGIIYYLLDTADNTDSITGIGIGMHGLVDYARGISIYPPAFGWTNTPVAEPLKREFDLPVIMENNVRALTLGENWFGAARKLRDFICLKVGPGIGSGIFTDGKLFRGTSNSAGEIGHTMVDEDGPLCTCGNYGCLESLASIPAIVGEQKRFLSRGQIPV